MHGKFTVQDSIIQDMGKVLVSEASVKMGLSWILYRIQAGSIMLPPIPIGDWTIVVMTIVQEPITIKLVI